GPCRRLAKGRGTHGSGTSRRSEALQRPVAGIGDLEQRVELGQLEKGLQVVVEIGETKLATLLADLLRERDQHSEAGAVDVAGLGEVDQKLAPAALELIENLLLQLLPIADDQLAFDVDHDDVTLFLDREAHSLVSLRACVFV